MDNCRGTISTNKNEEFIFEYILKYHQDIKGNIYFFDIWKEGDKYTYDKYSFLLLIMENGRDLKVIDLYANAYKGRGISIPIILKSKELFNKRIISSSNKTKIFSGEANLCEAITKVWEPMVKQGLAKYDSKYEYYYVL